MDPTNPPPIPPPISQTFSLHEEKPAAPPDISNFPLFKDFKISVEGGKNVFAVPVQVGSKTYQAKINFDLGMNDDAMIEAAKHILGNSNDSIPKILANFFGDENTSGVTIQNGNVIGVEPSEKFKKKQAELDKEIAKEVQDATQSSDPDFIRVAHYRSKMHELSKAITGGKSIDYEKSKDTISEIRKILNEMDQDLWEAPSEKKKLLFIELCDYASPTNYVLKIVKEESPSTQMPTDITSLDELRSAIRCKRAELDRLEHLLEEINIQSSSAESGPTLMLLPLTKQEEEARLEAAKQSPQTPTPTPGGATPTPNGGIATPPQTPTGTTSSKKQEEGDASDA